MGLLIDTQVFIWEITGAAQLSNRLRALLESGHKPLFISMASLWEMSIKSSLNKLDLGGPYEDVLRDVAANNVTLLPITFAHTVEQHRLPFHHRDPFDRLIAAQAISENLDLVSSDVIFDAYFAGQAVRRWF